MNSAQWTIPSTGSPHNADAVCAIGAGHKLFTGSGDESNTFGNGTLISPTQLLSCMHIFPVQSSGYHTLAQGQSTEARVARYRRKTDGTAPAGGLCVNYHQVHITGYRAAPAPLQDMVICDLASPVTHIPPIPIDTGTPAPTDPLVLVGWGLDGATANQGALPLDARMIEGKTIGSVTGVPLVNGLVWSGPNPGPNLHDSGGAVIRLVLGAWKLTGVIQSYSVGVAVEQFKHNEAFQLPGLYTPAPPEPVLPSHWLQSDDTMIQLASPTFNHSASSSVQVHQIVGKESDTAKSVFVGFNTSGLTAPILGASLVLTVAAINVGDRTIRVRRIRRSGVTHLANWNTYDGSAGWGTAGAENVSSDVYTDHEFTFVLPVSHPPNTPIVINHANLLAMLNAARLEDGVLRLLLEATDVSDAAAAFFSREYALPAFRPRLEVNVDLPIGGTVRTRSGVRLRS